MVLPPSGLLVPRAKSIELEVPSRVGLRARPSLRPMNRVGRLLAHERPWNAL
jgi:hypothetical protein